jgi:hypothetical protein
MRIAVTYAPQLSPWFSDVAIATHKAFNDIGHQADLIPSASLETFYHTHHELIFVIAPHGYQETATRAEVQYSKSPKKLYACWDLEQTPLNHLVNDKTLNRFERTLDYFHIYDFFFTESDARTNYFKQRGYKAHTLNFGYHPHYTKQVQDFNKEYDIFFVGIMFPRRSLILYQLKDAGVTLYPAQNNNFFDPNLKAEAVKKSKVCLNIHHNDMPYFEKPRIIQDIMSNGGFCITEDIAYPEGFVSGRHFIMSSYHTLTATVVDWLDREQERSRIAQQGFDFLSQQCLATKFLTEAMGIING